MKLYALPIQLGHEFDGRIVTWY